MQVESIRVGEPELAINAKTATAIGWIALLLVFAVVVTLIMNHIRDSLKKVESSFRRVDEITTTTVKKEETEKELIIPEMSFDPTIACVIPFPMEHTCEYCKSKNTEPRCRNCGANR